MQCHLSDFSSFVFLQQSINQIIETILELFLEDRYLIGCRSHGMNSQRQK